jgi:hypothetical protein
MGNGVSSATTPALSGSKETTKRFKDTLDLIATQYITTNDFKGLKMLVNEKYCDDLTILTKDILATRFTTKEIKTLAKTDTFFYISKNELARLEANTKDKKNRMCKQIARFYVRIAHLFASIITTVYPNWSDSGNGQQVQGQGQGQGTEFCNARINALKNSILEKKGDLDAVNIQPTVCSLYSNSSTLYAAPGFSALEVLYNDEYDETTGTFNRRSGAMQVKYENDLESLYEAFTGKTSKPSEVKSFSDINIAALSSRFSECGPKQKPDRSGEILQQEQLQQQQRQQQQQQQQEEQRRRQEPQDPYQYQQREQNPMTRIMEENNRELERIKLRAEIKEKSIRDEGANMSGVMATNTNTNLRVKKTGSSFSNYAAHIRTMAGNADKFKARLLEIVDKLFLVVKNDATSNQAKITIHPALSNEMLNQLVNQTRDIIVQLYLGCERDFYTGIKLLRVIIEEKMQETMEAALANLKAETVKQVKVLSQKNKENETTKRQNEVKAIQDAVNLNKNDINVASDEREDDLKKLTDELTNKKKDLEEAKQKSENFKKELELINAKIKQYTDEEKLVPAPGDVKLADLIAKLNTEMTGIEAKKKAVDGEIKTLTSEYETIKTRYDR